MNFYQFWAICVFIFAITAEFNVKPAEGTSCAEKNNSCSDCVGFKGNCFWCKSTGMCKNYVKDQKGCPSSEVYYKQCYVSGNLLIIIVPCVVGGLLIIIGCCIYCCCCRKCCSKKKGMFDKEDKKLKKDRMERKQLQDHRKAERQARNEEIRMKYGLKPASGDSRYQRMDPWVIKPYSFQNDFKPFREI